MHKPARLSSPTFAYMLISLVLVPSIALASRQQRQGQQQTLGLEIKISGSRISAPRMPGGGNRLIPRSLLKILDEAAAADFAAIDVISREDQGAMRVSVSIIYNDIKVQEWWKDKKEKPVGTYVVHEGETVRASELAQFGIEPFEFSAVDARSVVLSPSERPFITNRTQSLQVVSLEKSLDEYRLTLKNVGEKTIARFTVLQGSSGRVSGGLQPGAIDTAHFVGPVADGGITISNVVFEDGTFEGDAKSEALDFLAERQGQKIQAPSVLARILQTMEVADVDLPAAFEKL
jgi:hypothetical protein